MVAGANIWFAVCFVGWNFNKFPDVYLILLYYYRAKRLEYKGVMNSCGVAVLLKLENFVKQEVHNGRVHLSLENASVKTE